VLLHGWGANREQLVAQAAPLAKAGYGVLLLDFRAHGESGGDHCTCGDRERLDVDASIAFAASAPSVRPGGVAVVGFSMGALAAASAALDDPRVGALVLEAMPPTLERAVRREYRVHGPVSEFAALAMTRAVGIELERVRPVDVLSRRRVRPLLLVYGEHDVTVPLADGEELLARASGDAELWVAPGVGHGSWDAPASEAIAARISRFLSAAFVGR
jgi:uncharacterized protein